MSTNSKVVVITGASAGVGRAIAQEFARRQMRIGLLSRDAERLQRVVQEVERLGGQALAVVTDVGDAAQVEAAAQRIEDALGPIEIWVNNAMASMFSPFMKMTPEEFARVTQVTYLGTVHGTFSALKRMLPRGHGSIVQVGSALSERSIPLQSAYCGAKHGVRGFTDSIRSELLHDGSRVQITMVQLPALNTPQFDWVRSRLPRKAQPVPPIFQPEVAARAVVWAAEHRKRELYVGWPVVKAMLANKVWAGYADRYLARNGYDGQQTSEGADAQRPDNLFQSVPGPYGAHGRFDRRARKHSIQFWFATHYTVWMPMLVLILILCVAIILR